MNKSKSSLFLMEILISILLFSITSAVCIQVFVKADQMNKASKELAHSIQISQNFAEIMQSSPEPLEKIKSLFSNGYAEENRLTYFYDKSFEACEKGSESATYCSVLDFSSVSDMNHLEIRISNLNTDQEIYSLKVSKYWGLTGGGL